MTKISVEIELLPEEFVEVEFWGYVTSENNSIGGYECHGNVGYDVGTTYPLMDNDPDWNKSLYTADQNQIISDWVSNNDYVWRELFEKQALFDYENNL